MARRDRSSSQRGHHAAHALLSRVQAPVLCAAGHRGPLALALAGLASLRRRTRLLVVRPSVPVAITRSVTALNLLDRVVLCRVAGLAEQGAENIAASGVLAARRAEAHKHLQCRPIAALHTTEPEQLAARCPAPGHKPAWRKRHWYSASPNSHSAAERGTG